MCVLFYWIETDPFLIWQLLYADFQPLCLRTLYVNLLYSNFLCAVTVFVKHCLSIVSDMSSFVGQTIGTIIFMKIYKLTI